MKKTMIVAFFMIFMLTGLFSAGQVFININANVLFPADEGFSTTYSDLIICPEVKLGLKVVSDIYLWGSFLYINVKGKTQPLEAEAASTQYYVSGGLGYEIKFPRNIFLDIFGGVSYTIYHEEVLPREVDDNALGFCGGVTIKIMIYRKIYLSTEIAYIYGTDTIENKDFKLGGLKAGVGIGFRF